MAPELIVFTAVGLPVICGTIIALAAMFLGAKKKKNSDISNEDEAKLMQEMHQALIRMEKRIDSLETIYFEMERNKEKEKL